MTAITDALDAMFVSAPAIMEDLSKAGGYFTSQAFLRRIIHEQQHAYIDLLVACRHLPMPFDQAHQRIGARLSHVAPTYGYTADETKQPDENIFRLETASVIYRCNRP
jgi:hypothetical protein